MRTLLWTLCLSLTAFSAVGLTRLRVETGIVDWLPATHPNVEAFGALFEKLEGAVNQEMLWLEIDPQKARALGVDSISDHRSFLAQQELIDHLRSEVPGLRGAFGLITLLEMVRSLQAGEEASAGVPASRFQTRLAWNLVQLGSPDLVAALTSQDPDTPGTIVTLILDAPPLSERGRRTAAALERALQSYRDRPDKRFDLFEDRYLEPAGLASGTLTIDRTLREDLLRLTPVAALLLAIVLRLALGTWRAMLSVLGVTVVGGVWTMGLMGWSGTPVNVITFSLVPLVLGCGVDYAILISLDTLDRRRRGETPRQALRHMRRTSAAPILLTTLTTTAGMLTLAFSDSWGIAMLGLHAAAGMLGLALLTTTLLPGLLVRFAPGSPSRFGPIVAPVATSIVRNRGVVITVASIVTVASVFIARNPNVLLDVIEGNYRNAAPISRTVERVRELCGGVFPEIVIVRGDLADPRSQEVLRDVKKALLRSETIGEEFRVVGAPDLLDTYAALRGKGVPGVGAGATTTPGDADWTSLAGEIYAKTGWQTVARLFFDPQLQVGTFLLLGGDAGRDSESVAVVWNELERITESANDAAAPIEFSFLGYRTMAHLFVEHSERWIHRTLIVSLTVILALTAIFLRNLRAVLVMAIVTTVGGLWWLALLQAAGIPISIFLLFPLVFAICVASDYGLHMLCRLRADRPGPEQTSSEESQLGWTRRAWMTTGRAIAIAALTDGLIFFVFWRMSLVNASNVMLAAALAVIAVFACTIFLVPALAVPPATPHRGRSRSEARSSPPSRSSLTTEDAVTQET